MSRDAIRLLTGLTTVAGMLSYVAMDIELLMDVVGFRLERKRQDRAHD